MHYEIITIIAADVGRKLHSGVETEAKPARSAPQYTDLLPKFREVAHGLITVDGKKVHTITKFYEPDTIVVEAHAIVEDLFAKNILNFKKAMLVVCSDMVRKCDGIADIYEEYTLFCVSGYKEISQFDKHKARIVGLMRNEVEEMGKGVVESALKESGLKYSSNDLVVVGWDSAVLFSDNSSEFPEIIEVLITGNIQLLKIRLLNKELEEGLKSIYGLLSVTTFRWFKFRQILKHIIELRAKSIFELEHTKTNINLLGDWYTATLYALTIKKFHLEEKMAEVDKRLDALEDVYEMFTQRLNSSYMLLFEFLITVLIIFEIAMAFL